MGRAWLPQFLLPDSSYSAFKEKKTMIHAEAMKTHNLERQFSSVQSLSHARLFATPWTAARQASLSITNSRSLSKLLSIESVMPSNHLILCHPLLILPSIFPNIRVFSKESAQRQAVMKTRYDTEADIIRQEI